MTTFRNRHRAPLKKQRTGGHPTLQGKVNRLQRVVNALRPELKVVAETDVFTNVPAAAGTIIYLTAIGQGSDIVNRIGDRISIKEIELNCELTGGTPAQPGGNLTNFGVYLIKDMESNGVIPVVSGTAQSIFSAAGTLQAMVQPSTRERFKIVRQWCHNTAELQGGNTPNHWKWVVPCSGQTFYHDTTANQTGAGKNAYYLVCLSEDLGDTVDFAIFSQVRFTDV